MHCKWVKLRECMCTHKRTHSDDDDDVAVVNDSHDYDHKDNDSENFNDFKYDS